MSGSSSSLCWSEGEEDRVADLSRDKTLLILKVKGLEDQVLKLMRIKIRNEDVMKRQAEEINGLSNQLKVLTCSLRSSKAKATLLEDSLVLGRRIEKLHPPYKAALSPGSAHCVCASSACTEFKNSIKLLPALVSRLENALGRDEQAISVLPKVLEKEPSKVSDDGRWLEFREQVSKLKVSLDLDPSFALVHPDPGPGLLDLSVVRPEMFDHKKFHISKQSHERAIKTSRTYTAYATAVLHDYFKSSVTMFCTCIGSSKGKAADGHERASLPKVALEAFLEHCCSVGTLVYEVKESPESMKKRLQKAINMHLQAQRKKNSFVPTDDQIQSYSITMHRGKNTASCSEISSLHAK